MENDASNDHRWRDKRMRWNRSGSLDGGYIRFIAGKEEGRNEYFLSLLMLVEYTTLTSIIEPATSSGSSIAARIQSRLPSY